MSARGYASKFSLLPRAGLLFRTGPDGIDVIGKSVKTTNSGIGLDVVDYIGGTEGKVIGASGSYIFSATTTKLYRREGRLGAPSLVKDFADIEAGLEPQFLWSFSSGVYVFAKSATSSGIYKSVDNGPSWTLSSDLNGKFLLPRGMCEDARGYLYYGTYQTNDSGSVLAKSSDLGETFVEAATWTSAYVRHIHAVVHNNNNIYICFGDTGPETGILLWDGVSALTSNTYPKDYVKATHGADGIGDGQDYRTCDILFFGGKAYYIADTTGNASAGIWRMNLDLSGSTQIDTQIQAYANHSGYLGVIHKNSMIFSEFIENGGDPATTNLQMNFWCSSDGLSWVNGGLFGAIVSISGGASCFEVIDGHVYFSRRGAGKDYLTTAIFDIADGAPSPRILHPVYWVTKTGSDSNNGYRPNAPFLTVRYALQGDRITNGARVIVGPGLFEETGFIPDFDGNLRKTNDSAETVIEGSGIGQTEICCNAASTYLFYIEAEEAPFKARAAKFYTKSSAQSTIFSCRAQATFKGAITTEDALIGSLNDNARAFDVYTQVKAKRCVFDLSKTGGNLIVPRNGGSIDVEHSVVRSAASILNTNVAGFTPKFLNTILAGYSGHGVVSSATATVVPVIKNTIFAPDAGALSTITDLSGATETDTEMDYNCFFGGPAPTNIANDGGSHSISADPLFVDAVGGDFRLQSNSPCIGAGVKTVLTGTKPIYDGNKVKIYDGTTQLPDGPFLDGVDIGAFAYVVGGKYYWSLLGPDGAKYWPSAPEIIDVVGVNNAIYNADGTGKTFATEALALAALVSLEDGVRLVGGVGGKRDGAAMWGRDLTAPESTRANNYFG